MPSVWFFPVVVAISALAALFCVQGGMNSVTPGVPVPVKVPMYSVHLDAIRGGAALVVFLTHLRYIFLGSSGLSAPTADIVHGAEQQVQLQRLVGTIDLGHKSVMVFFVLSGYFVGGSVLRLMRQERWSWKSYCLQRMTRLWVVLLPALLLGLVVDSIGFRFFPDSIYGEPAGQFILTRSAANHLDAITLLGNLFFLQTIFVTPFGTNLPLWSLANEFWYYLAFPLLLFVLVGHRGAVLRLFCGMVFLGVVFLVGGAIASYFLIWMLGVAVSLLPLRFSPRMRLPMTGLALCGLASACVLLRYHEAASSGWSEHFLIDAVVGLCFSFLLYCLLHWRDMEEPGIYHAGARFFSRMSYSLYLVHLPLLFLASAVTIGHWHRWPSDPMHLLAAAGVAVTILFLSYLFHLCFEAHTDRIRQWLMARI